MAASQPWYRWDGTVLELRVRVQTQCRDEGPADVSGDSLRVRVNPQPVDGKANKRLLVILAGQFGVARSRVRLAHGAKSLHKWIRIEHPQVFPGPLGSALSAASQVEKSAKAV